MGDGRQILPIVKGSHGDTIAATFTSSPVWPKFRQWTLTKNMRILSCIASLADDSSDEDRADVDAQVAYASAIQAIGEGRKGRIRYNLNSTALINCTTRLQLYDYR
jgi:hypothetical protein